jgi:hypothetical protein
MLLRLRLPHSTIRLGDRLAATSGVGHRTNPLAREGAAREVEQVAGIGF